MVPGKSAPFVLDFVNQAEDIFRAFKPYYDATSLQEKSDPALLEQLKHELDLVQVYHSSEVEAFARVFYKPVASLTLADDASLERHLQPAVDRFKGLPDEEQRTAFRDKLSGYVNLYAFLSQIIPYGDQDLEMLYTFGRLLMPHLPHGADAARVRLGDEVSLRYYRMERLSSGAIDLTAGDDPGVKSPTATGTGKAQEQQAPLSEIIQALNDRLGTQFTEEDRLFFQQIKERACSNEQVVQTALANPLDKFSLGIKKLIADLMIERMAQNDKIVTRYMADPKFQGAAFPILAREIFESVRAEAGKTACS